MNAKNTPTAPSSSNSTSLDQLLGRIEAYYNLKNDRENNTSPTRDEEAFNTPNPTASTPEVKATLSDMSSTDTQRDVTKGDAPSKRTLPRISQRGQRKMENLPAQKSEAHYLSFAVDLLRIIDDYESDGDDEDSLFDQ